MAQPQNSPSQNTAWGFYGTISSHADPDEAWPLAMTAIGTATGCPGEAVRDFLDSRHGRHFRRRGRERPLGEACPQARDRRRCRTLDGLEDQPPDPPSTRDSERPALTHGLRHLLRDRGRNRLANPVPLRPRLGVPSGASGSSSAAMVAARSTEGGSDPMKLTDTQMVILTAAAQRDAARSTHCPKPSRAARSPR